MNTYVQYMFFLAGLSLFSVGCGSTEVHQVFLRHPSLNSRRDIVVYVTGAPPHRAYYEIAILQAVGHGSDADVEDVTHAIANRGARLGCDAVIRLHVELGATRAHASAVCVNWAEGTAAQAIPAAPPAIVPSPATPSTEAPPSTPPPATSPPAAPGDSSGGTSI